jgi:cysteinyl-tRNA synthetase
MYNCGPTVYDYFHIGNARNFVCADTIRRYLTWRGYTVKFVQNITDIDDKIIARAEEMGCSPSELAEKFTKIFFEDSRKLGVQPADHYPRATQYVDKMIAPMIQLEKVGITYTVEGNLYFRVRQFKGYGKLSGRLIDNMQIGTDVNLSDRKEDPADFVLWKAAKPNEPSWSSPWGPGRPGWHSECCVMSKELLGEEFDIHMGGIDLVFPHHENEIAQNETLSGKPFVHYWIHNGFLNLDGKKMSKSLGNFFTIDQVLSKFEAQVVRYFLLTAHYRVPLDFSEMSLHDSSMALNRLREARHTVNRLLGSNKIDCTVSSEIAKDIYRDFQIAMDDDFNTPRALASLFKAVTQINQYANTKIPDLNILAELGRTIDELGGGILGFTFESPTVDIERLVLGLSGLLSKE